MEHTRLKPMQGASGREKTAFTMQTIQEMLAEEVSNVKGTPKASSSAAVPNLQQPPHMVRAAPPEPVAAKPSLKASTAQLTVAPMPMPVIPKAASFPAIAPTGQETEDAAAKPRSFFGRLIGS